MDFNDSIISENKVSQPKVIPAKAGIRERQTYRDCPLLCVGLTTHQRRKNAGICHDVPVCHAELVSASNETLKQVQGDRYRTPYFHIRKSIRGITQIADRNGYI